jgi:hypothetical protein
MATQPRHLYRLPALLDRRHGDLGRAVVVVEAHRRSAWKFLIGHNEPHARKQFPPVELHFRRHPQSGELCL